MNRTFGQSIAYLFALLSFVAAAVCVVAAWLYQAESATDAIRGSLLASVVFFLGTGTVLYVIGTARLKGLLTLHPGTDARR